MKITVVLHSLIIWSIFFVCTPNYAQLMMHDRASKGNYEKVADYEKTMTRYRFLEAAMVNAIGSSIKTRKDNKTPRFWHYYQKDLLLDFLERNCKLFIAYKYPLVGFNGSNPIANAAIQLRMRRKIDYEKDRIRDYMGEIRGQKKEPLYITEGNRILLSLSALESCIQIVLEDETY
ncbi:hypothetical protein FGM00_11300 [Aggregatimonas sangjinii]|uniref:Uncharacterized protein n=1 Tax=Aggregatimonas sangjinii TaxID=2583587 RepID=A0A5B7SU87_9FLAO|nr:hypothetical protein [Aggregatimonas sangjinii]QCX00663.1 hypothetical protein FGM00_11300 [Aggregatimonas sangjinii]